ncbi:unnamed protein product, partial [Porites lobata]
MGDCADDIIKMLSINEATPSLDKVKTALNGYFAANRNVIVEQAWFNRRRQNPSESTLKYRQSKLTELIYVVHNQKCSLLSRRACVELGLVRHANKDVEEVNSGLTHFQAKFPALFSQLNGKHQVMADKLSRAPVNLPGLEDKLLVEEVEAFL